MSISQNMSPKSKAKAKPRGNAKGRSVDENLVQKFRYHLTRSKDEVRKEYKKLGRAEQKEFLER